MPDVNPPNRAFISYASSDRSLVFPVIEVLRSLGTSSWLDIHEIRAGDRLEDTLLGSIEKCSSVVVMLSKASAGSDWVKREVAHALKLIERGHNLQVIPCLLEKCEPLEALSGHAHADFTTRHSFGMRNLLAGVFRGREAVSCRIDPAHPLQLVEEELRAELEGILLARDGSPEFVFYLDAADILTELKSLPNPYSELLGRMPHSDAMMMEVTVASAGDRAPLLLQNLGVALGAVAREVFSGWQREPGIGKMLLSTLQATAFHVLYDFWCTVRTRAGRDLTRLSSVQGEVLQRRLAEIEDLNSAQDRGAFAERARFRCTLKELLDLGLQGRPPVADGRLWVPASEVLSDTREDMKQGIFPIHPVNEFMDLTWLSGFVPGLARSHVWRCSSKGLRLADHAHQFSVSKEDYLHVGIE